MKWRVRSNHWAAFRSGEWAEIVTDDIANGRPCWLVSFDDGTTDIWVKNDPDASYEFDLVAGEG